MNPGKARQARPNPWRLSYSEASALDKMVELGSVGLVSAAVYRSPKTVSTQLSRAKIKILGDDDAPVLLAVLAWDRFVRAEAAPRVQREAVAA